MSVIKFGSDRAVRSRAKKRTRYKPSYFRDGTVLSTAEECRTMDVEMLVERLSEEFLRHINLMNDDQLALLDLLAEAAFTYDEDKQARHVKAAAALRFMKRRTEPKGGA